MPEGNGRNPRGCGDGASSAMTRRGNSRPGDEDLRGVEELKPIFLGWMQYLILDEACLRGRGGMAVSDERQRSPVERGGAANELCFSETIL